MKAGDRGDGWMFQRGGRWLIGYYVRGKKFRESGGGTEAAARKRLKERMKEIYGDRFAGPQQERVTVEQLCDDLEANLKLRGVKALATFKSHLKPIRDHFGAMRGWT